MPNWNEDWPDSTNLRERRAAFVEREMAKLQKPVDPLAADFIERQRKAMASANEYCLARDPRSVSERLGYGVPRSPMGASWTAGDPDGEE